MSFTPYTSPLQYFRSYRFHPKYMDGVDGGLRSLTYSSKIDLRVGVCPYELDGKECPDGPTCEFQHFQSMLPKGELGRPRWRLLTSEAPSPPFRSLTAFSSPLQMTKSSSNLEDQTTSMASKRLCSCGDLERSCTNSEPKRSGTLAKSPKGSSNSGGSS